MRLRHIEIFHAIYTTGSITSAAKLLYVSQPSVSKVLAHAEMQLGFKLFERTKGKLVPTSEANMLFSEVDKIYKQLYSIKKMSENIKRSEHGIVDIAITPALGFELIPNAISKFREKHPNVQFKLQTLHNDEALQSLIEHKCDLAILYSSPSMPGVTEIELGQSEVVVLYPKEQFPQQPQTMEIEQLANKDLIGIWDSGPVGELVWNNLNNSDMEVISTMQVDTYYIAAGLVSKGAGCCTIDKLTARANLADNVGMASFEPTMNFQIKGLHLETRPLPKICTEFLTFVREEMAFLT